MPDTASLIAFAAIALGMVLTPGPNMVYLVSRSISQGRAAGLISLGGVALGFVFYMLCAAFGITDRSMYAPHHSGIDQHSRPCDRRSGAPCGLLVSISNSAHRAASKSAGSAASSAHGTAIRSRSRCKLP